MAETNKGGEIYEIVKIGKKCEWHEQEEFLKGKRVRLTIISKIPRYKNSYGAFGVKFIKSFGFTDKNGRIRHFNKDFLIFFSHIKLKKV